MGKPEYPRERGQYKTTGQPKGCLRHIATPRSQLLCRFLSEDRPFRQLQLEWWYPEQSGHERQLLVLYAEQRYQRAQLELQLYQRQPAEQQQ